jgi:uncharacterized membrane protein
MSWRLYLLTAVPFWIADAIWLGFVAKDFYRRALAPLMAPRVNPWPAALFYLAYPAGLVIFVLYPAHGAGPPRPMLPVILGGGLFGLFCYGTYDLVNQATLKDWPWRLTFVDMAWGTTISALSVAIALSLTASLRF